MDPNLQLSEATLLSILMDEGTGRTIEGITW